MVYPAQTLFLRRATSIFCNHTTVSYAASASKPSRLLRRCSSSAALEAVDAGEPPELHHPWPEWVSFVDRLKSQGYFPSTGESDVGGDGDCGAGSLYKNMVLLKEPCLSFARDRFDIFKSLPKKDIENVVGSGCPNLLRKSVNSSKRLRAFLQLDEGEVCSSCNLRGSCDRAYVVLKDSDGPPRTVDIVRILLSHALDPLVVSGGVRPPGRELVELSSKKLLCELIKLSETPPDPSLPEPASKTCQRKEQSMNYVNDEPDQDIEMKRGDWMCPKCNFLNFSKNLRCLKCLQDGPKKVSGRDIEIKEGDWICSGCSFMNFSRNVRCLKCKAEGPKKFSESNVQMKKGDWNCPQCGFMNFASNRDCKKCREPRPSKELKRGDWECPECDFLNFSKNAVCLKCKCDNPNEARADR